MSLGRLGRSEWWLWASAAAVVLLASLAFALSSFPPLFYDHSFPVHIRPEQTVTGVVALVLLFNAYAVHRQWQLRQVRRQLTGPAGEQGEMGLNDSASETDPVTGLATRRYAEQWLAKEIAQARRNNKLLTLLVMDLDDFKQLNRIHGNTTGDVALQEFAKRLKKASRGSDLAVRLGGDEFLLVLPECSLPGVKHVLSRISPMELRLGQDKITLTCSASWIEYESGELPSELLHRADQMLHLFKNAGDNPVSIAVNSD